MINILISNDDGVHAPGIRILRNALADIAEVLVVAPTEERSTTGHSLTLNVPLRLQKLEENIYACTGFPADCVLMGLGHLCKENRPDLVISGINRGGNLGQDVFYSGTLAAAREAIFHDVPAIAVSAALELASSDLNHDDVYHKGAQVIRQLVLGNIHKRIPRGQLLNINIPPCSSEKIKGIRYTRTGFRLYSEEISERIDERNRKYYWIVGRYGGIDKSIPNSDGLAIDESCISVGAIDLWGCPCDAEKICRPILEKV